MQKLPEEFVKGDLQSGSVSRKCQNDSNRSFEKLTTVKLINKSE